MGSQYLVRGSIVDSWIERSSGGTRVVLQVAPSGKRGDLMIIEAATALLADRRLLQDLKENLCHGNPIVAIGRPTGGGTLHATALDLRF